MFMHNLKYSLKILFRNKMLIFWTFAFPIILGTFFNMAFSNIEKNEQLDIIPIAIVDNEYFRNNDMYKETFEKLGESNSEQLFDIKYVDLKTAEKLLDKNEISGYLLLEEEARVVVKKSGINETILKQVAQEIEQTNEIMTSVVEIALEKKLEPEKIDFLCSKIYKEVLENREENNIVDKSSNNLSYTMIEFYTLIAMACLYGGIFGVVSINQNLPNMSSKGKRVALAPTSKSKLIFSSILASYITQIIGLFLLFIYTIFILKVDYGNNLPLIILLALTGGLAGLSMGIAISSIIKKNEGIKTGIVISITMLGCFLSGMMGITMKYVVDKNVPIINKINPASMITDGFYSLYYYDTLDRFYFNIISLLVFSFIMIFITILSLRRQKYDSI